MTRSGYYLRQTSIVLRYTAIVLTNTRRMMRRVPARDKKSRWPWKFFSLQPIQWIARS